MDFLAAFFHRIVRARQAIFAKGVVRPEHGNARYAHGAQVLHEFVDFIAIAGADIEHMVNRRLADQICAGKRRNQRQRWAFLGQQRQDGSHVGRARDVAQGKYIAFFNQFGDVFGRGLGPVAIVESDQAQTPAMHAALGIDLLKIRLCSALHIRRHLRQGAAQIQRLANDDFTVCNPRRGLRQTPRRQRCHPHTCDELAFIPHIPLPLLRWRKGAV